MTAVPEPPTGVVLHAPDGAEYACDVRYVGRDADGITIWRAVPAGPVPAQAGEWQLKIEALPARTRVILPGPYRLTDDGEDG